MKKFITRVVATVTDAAWAVLFFFDPHFKTFEERYWDYAWDTSSTDFGDLGIPLKSELRRDDPARYARVMNHRRPARKTT